jgi:hypothetical protein
MLLKQKISLILPLLKHKALSLLRSYLFSSNWVSFLAHTFAIQVEYCTLQNHIYTRDSLFFTSVPNNHSFRSR